MAIDHELRHDHAHDDHAHDDHAHDDHAHDDQGGLHRDLPRLIGRREALRWMGGMSLAALLAACGVSDGDDSTTSSGASATGATATTPAQPPVTTAPSGPEIPDEAAGPFPADGSNGPNVLTLDGAVKADLTTSFGDAAGTADGIPARFALTVVAAESGAALTGAVVYLWHCTADGRYSIYEIADQNYLRGLQPADGDGLVTFESVFPGCYPGRWPHCHLEVYGSLDEATVGAIPIKTSQLAFPEADCQVVYRDGRYGRSAEHLAQLSLATDGVFRDGWSDQLAAVSGSAEQGFVASLTIRV